MTCPAPRDPATCRWFVHRGARIEARLGLGWEANITMLGATAAEPVFLRASLSAGIEGVLAQARALVDQRLTAGMTIMLRRASVNANGDRPHGARQVPDPHEHGT